MKIFDFNIHLYEKTKSSKLEYIKHDTELTVNDLISRLNKIKVHLINSKIKGCNFMLFNFKIIFDPNITSFLQIAKNLFSINSFTILVPHTLRLDDIYLIKKLGFTFIKFHSYVQKIEEKNFRRILKICKIAETVGLGICIDTSYGTTGLYKFDNLKLAAYISENINDVPIVFLHSGGARVLEAMLIADLCSNVYLETSLSLNFYKNFNLLGEFANAYKRIGLNRVLFASDFPYQNIDLAIKETIDFFENNGFSDSDIEMVMFENAKILISNLE